MFKGTGYLTVFILRHQRFRILIWLIGLATVTVAVAASYPGIYPDEGAKLGFALTMQNPAMQAMVGAGYDMEDYSSLGVLFAHEMLLFTAIAVAVMNILLTGRSTRADEEHGRTEMIRSLPVGRLSYLSAALIVIVLANVLLALLTGTGLSLSGVEGMDWESSFLYGAVLGGTGLIFAGFTAFLAQLAETSRGTVMLSFTALITAYLMRAMGDVNSDVLSLLSPLGWTVRSDVFAANDWWPVYASMAAAALLSVAAFYLNAIRDSEAGFIPAKPGRKHATAFSQTLFGFVLKQQRTNIIVWAVIMFIFSVSFGFILEDLETYFSELEIMESFLAGESDSTMTDQFMALLIAIMAMINTVPAVMAMLHLKGEENRNRIENLLSRAVSRTRLIGTYFFTAILVSFVMQTLIALGIWSSAVAVVEGTLRFSTVLTAVFAYLPAIWIIIGLAAFLTGFLPKLTSFVWFYLTYSFIVLYLGGILDFPEWLHSLSVFEHTPETFVENLEAWIIIAMIAIAAVLVIPGFIGYNKRDIESQ